ncbi:hypothetical protein TEA_006669 [Camellia sinensis var. sinensis]|uniref:Uncharacterized protein n=1 Tax=Camellia sinensis var. sinensis TaxID=542762 RepID=A0A4S4DVG4_CAMSN|nr:hypothetical protein TEA_006669 [Camellia sinensis var. sinensis]
MANNASHRGTRNPLYDEDNEESTGFNHELNPTAPINQQLSNKAVSRQLVEIAQMLAQLTLQNQPTVPEPIDHYEEEIRRKPPIVPVVSLAPTPMNQIVPYVPPQSSDPLMEKTSRLEQAVNKLSGDKHDIVDLENLSLYPKVKLPYGFKWLEIDKALSFGISSTEPRTDGIVDATALRKKSGMNDLKKRDGSSQGLSPFLLDLLLDPYCVPSLPSISIDSLYLWTLKPIAIL